MFLTSIKLPFHRDLCARVDGLQISTVCYLVVLSSKPLCRYSR